MQDDSGLVHIVDDDAGMRKSLLALVESVSLRAKSYDSAEDFLDEIDAKEPGCIVLDIRMPGMSGIELLAHLQTRFADFPVILISGHADVPTAVNGMKLGAIELLQKPFESGVFLEAVQKALSRGIQLHQQRQRLDSTRQRLTALTRRELELLKLVVEGKSNKQIAAGLNISIKTVANHRASLMSKTGALNAADLGRLYMAASLPKGE